MIFKQLNSSHILEVENILKSHESMDFERFGLRLSAAQIEYSLSKDICFGFFDGDKLLAFILGRKVDQEIFEIDMTMTNKADLKKGHMEKFFKEMIMHLKNNGVFYKIWLEVHEENNPALSFYKKMGFTQNSARSKYYPDGKAAILMTLIL
ncbi:MAG: GNAT family N-acetyltransferase [Bdellovibrionota bacterium]